MNRIESALLSVLTFNPEARKITLPQLNPKIFSSPDARKFVAALIEIAGNGGPVDEVSIAEKSKIPPDRIAEILGGELMIPLENIPAHLHDIKKAHLVKKFIHELNKCNEEELKKGEIFSPRLLEAYHRIGELGDRKSVSDALMKGADLQKMEISIDWIADGAFPENSLTVLFGPGGLGKTFLVLQLGKDVSQNDDFFSLRTKKTNVVFIDYENSLPILKERVSNMKIDKTLFWHLSADPRPPKLDKDDYTLLFDLPEKSLLIFDSLRAAHDGDENSSKDMGLVMGRLKELREAGFTVLVVHHTGKGSDRIYKGSTAISDLADHVVGFHKVKKNNFDEIDDDSEPDPGAFYRLGTRDKTRFKPFHLFLHFSQDGSGFVQAEDPDEADLQQLLAIIGKNRFCQSEIFNAAKDELGIKKKGRIVNLLNKGESRLWYSYKDGRKVVYDVVS